jgi:hypothetical protein
MCEYYEGKYRVGDIIRPTSTQTVLVVIRELPKNCGYGGSVTHIQGPNVGYTSHQYCFHSTELKSRGIQPTKYVEIHKLT